MYKYTGRGGGRRAREEQSVEAFSIEKRKLDASFTDHSLHPTTGYDGAERKRKKRSSS
jgi:hypothetical protein